jgi:hypothetical protein
MGTGGMSDSVLLYRQGIAPPSRLAPLRWPCDAEGPTQR